MLDCSADSCPTDSMSLRDGRESYLSQTTPSRLSSGYHSYSRSVPFTYGPKPTFIACSQDSNRGSTSARGGAIVTPTDGGTVGVSPAEPAVCGAAVAVDSVAIEGAEPFATDGAVAPATVTGGGT